MNEQGSDLLLRVAGGDSSSHQLVVHIVPNISPFTDLEDSVRLPDWLSERWKVLTLRVASPESHESGKGLQSPEFLFHYGSADCLSFDKVGCSCLRHLVRVCCAVIVAFSQGYNGLCLPKICLQESARGNRVHPQYLPDTRRNLMTRGLTPVTHAFVTVAGALISLLELEIQKAVMLMPQ